MPKHYSTNDSIFKRKKPQIIRFLLVLAVVIVVSWVYMNFIQTPEPETSSTNTDCSFFKMITPEDSSFGEASAGTYEYVLYTTSKGIEVWKCDRNSL